MLAKPVATVHDSIEIVCPKEEVNTALSILYDEMVNYPLIKKIFNIHFDVPLAIDAEVGKSFGDGEEVHFNNGIPIL
jgi:DNA polymerase I-like protein with 3'-5' exonuclease and polymerase domains